MKAKRQISHEREAEELRRGVEELAGNADLVRNMCAAYADEKAVLVSDLLDLLDRVDARDSLAFLEKKDRRARKRRRAK